MEAKVIRIKYFYYQVLLKGKKSPIKVTRPQISILISMKIRLILNLSTSF